jgi:hypothetical protein
MTQTNQPPTNTGRFSAEDPAVTMTMPMPLRRPAALIPSAVQRRIQFTLEHGLDQRPDMFAHARFQRIKPVLAQQWNRIVIGGNLLQGVISCGGGQIAGAGSSPSGDYAASRFPTNSATRPQVGNSP